MPLVRAHKRNEGMRVCNRESQQNHDLVVKDIRWSNSSEGFVDVQMNSPEGTKVESIPIGLPYALFDGFVFTPRAIAAKPSRYCPKASFERNRITIHYEASKEAYGLFPLTMDEGGSIQYERLYDFRLNEGIGVVGRGRDLRMILRSINSSEQVRQASFDVEGLVPGALSLVFEHESQERELFPGLSAKLKSVNFGRIAPNDDRYIDRANILFSAHEAYNFYNVPFE